MTRTLTKLILLMGVLILPAGCASMAPDYKQPELPVAEAWPQGEAYGEATDGPTAAELPWREFFRDERLQQLIELALENNRDLRVAALNVERARAQYRIQRSDLFPEIGAGGSFNRQRQPDITGFGRVMHFEQYGVNLGLASWELDFFGRIRSLKEQALESYFATEEARRAARIALIGEVANAYLNLAADRERQALARETLASHQSTYDLTQRRFELGVASALEVRQAQTSVEGTKVDISRFTSLIAEDENALRLLTGGEAPATLLPAPPLKTATTLSPLSAGVSSEVLLQRPDILAVEHRLKGANANIGAARAAFYPRISLTTNGGFASTELSDLFTSDARAWAFSPRIDIPIFTAGRLQAQLETAEIDRDILINQYEGAIQTAFREVADTLARRGTIDEQLQAQRALVEATSETYRLSETRFDKGIDSFLQVLDAQRALYGAQQNLINIELAELASQVNLYKVLGGGGTEPAREVQPSN